MKGCVLQTFGVGNMPSERTDIFNEIKLAIERGCIIVNCSQCIRGQVDAEYYTSKVFVIVVSQYSTFIQALYNMGVIAGSDMTIEAALTKLAYVLGKDEWNIRTKKQVNIVINVVYLFYSDDETQFTR
jgi:lysophospholipase